MVDRGFPKQSRLLKAGEYKAVFSNAQFKVSCRYLLFLANSNGNSRSRIGLVVAKKNVPTAVQRNRIKRQIREYFRLNSEVLDGLDLVVLVRKDADKLHNRELSSKMASLVGDLGNKFHKHNTNANSPN